MLDRLYHWASDKCGSMAPMMAVGLLALIIVAGGQTDFAARNAKEIKLQAAVDAAALGAATDSNVEAEERARLAEEVFAANVRDAALGSVSDFVLDVDATDETVTVTATGNHKTNFLPLVGLSQLEVDAKAVALNQVPELPIEFVMAMDSTTSILGTGAERTFVENAVRDTFKALIAAQQNGLDIVPSFLPFNDRVNLSDFNIKSGKGDVDPFNFGQLPFPAEGNGCFEPREAPLPGFPHALDDTPPTLGHRFEFTDTFGTEGLASRGGSGADDPNTKFDEGSGGDNRPIAQRSPICAAPAALDIRNIGQINSTLAKLTARGTGRFDVALAWGWRMLSPRWKGEWGLGGDYPGDTASTRKVLAILTDAHSNAWRYEAGGSNGTFESPTPNNQVTDEGFAHIVDLCSRIKASGVEIRVILAFSYPRAVDPFRQCASTGQFFEVSSREQFLDQIQSLASIARDTRLIE